MTTIDEVKAAAARVGLLFREATEDERLARRSCITHALERDGVIVLGYCVPIHASVPAVEAMRREIWRMVIDDIAIVGGAPR